MPVITYAGAVLPNDKKKELIENLTGVAAEVTGISARFMTVLIQEYSDEGLGMGGETVTEIKKRMAAKQ